VRRLASAVASAAALGGGAFGLAACGGAGAKTAAPGSAHASFDGPALPTPVAAPPFTLTDVDGASVSLGAYRGRVAILAFLDSTCRACVLIAQQVRGALDELAKPPPVLLVSANPAGDSRTSVEAFLRQTGLAGRARYLVGPPGALGVVLHAYRVRTPSEGQAEFETAATVYLLDAGGRERVVYQEEELTPEALAHDVRALESG